MCQSKTNEELGEIFEGFVNRCKALGVPLPDEIIADNCCVIGVPVRKYFPGAHLALDIYHEITR